MISKITDFIENAVGWFSDNVVYNSKIPKFLRIGILLAVFIPIFVFALDIVTGVAELAVRLISLFIVIGLVTGACKIFRNFIRSMK